MSGFRTMIMFGEAFAGGRHKKTAGGDLRQLAFFGLVQPQEPGRQPGKEKAGGESAGKWRAAIIHECEPNRIVIPVKGAPNNFNLSADKFLPRNPAGNPDIGTRSPVPS